jgi:pyrroline-5-carboxylate reductase
MSKALIGGLVKRGYAPSKMRVVEIEKGRCASLHEEFGVRATTEMSEAVSHCETVMLAVKPQQLQQACGQLSPLLKGQLVISIAAGIRTQNISRWLKTLNIVRAMPNTPALIRQGVTGLYALPTVQVQEKERAEAILEAVGSTLWVAEEALLDAVTGISGSGPAYVFFFIDALQHAARELGMDELQARQLVLDTFIGASKLADSSKESVATLRSQVTSKNGTTERALLSMSTNQVKQHIITAAYAAAARSKELGDELGKDA